MTPQIDQQVAVLLDGGERFLLTSHVRPDADAAGSLLGLGLALKNKGKSVQMVLQDGAEPFSYLPGFGHVTRDPVGEIDTIIVVDCSDPTRVGSVLDAFGQPDLVIDHHKTNLAFGKINVVEPDQVATAAILTDRMPTWGLTIDAEVAMCLLAGIVGDTIGFRTPNVDAQVLRKSADLMEQGGNLALIYNEELVLRSLSAVRYWGAGLNRVTQQGHLVWTSLTLADREMTGYVRNDDADLVNVLTSVREAKIAVIFVEQPGNKVKISWRARPGLDVSGIAFQFGGGGHAAASGAEVEGTLSEILPQVIQATQAYLDKNH